MDTASSFGEYMKQLRADSRQGLRKFCSLHGFDPGNVSRIERGVFPPPQDEEKLAHYAKSLQLRPNSEEWNHFFDLAALENGRLPPDIAADKELVRKLPLLCRTIQNRPITPQGLQRLIDMIGED